MFPALCILFAMVMALAGWRFAGRGQSASDEQALVKRFTAALQSNRHEQAIALGRELVGIAPTNAGYAYNFACALAKGGQSDEANIWLKNAGERGFAFLATMQRDEDLATVRDTPGFAEALKIVKVNSDRELEAFKREVADDEPIVVLPPKHDPEKASPLIIALHGSGGHAADFMPAWREAAAEVGAVLVVPEGRLKFGDGWRWGKVEHGEWQVLHAIEQAKARFAINFERIIVTGFSEGGSVSLIVALRNPQAVTGAIPMCGEYSPDVSPVVKAKDGDRTPRMYVITGELDRDVESNRRACRDLDQAGWTVRLREFEGMGHSFPPNAKKVQVAALKWVMSKPEGD